MSNPSPTALDVDQLTDKKENEGSAIEMDQSDVESFYSYEFPSSDDDEHFYNTDNHQTFLDDHLTRHQRRLADLFEIEKYQRSKHSNKKLKFKRHRSKNEIQKVKFESHCQPICVHHRLVKMFSSKLSSRIYYPKESTINFQSNHYDNPHANFPPVQNFYRQPSGMEQDQFIPSPVFLPVIPAAIRQYTLNHQTVTSQAQFDDQMVAFLIEMQNRELSPEDYEMLLRLDERIERKTIQASVLDKFITILANETHLNDKCTICMDNYALGEAMKQLPCQHIFHCHCIENYLKEFSNKCPLDNLVLE